MSNYQQLSAGAHLVISKGLYNHHGLYLGNNTVMHYAGMSDSWFDFSQSQVQQIHLQQFVGQSKLEIRPHAINAFSTDKILHRAYSRVGEDKYNVITNNCEHFVNWCIYGENASSQIKTAVTVLGVLALSVPSALITRRFI